MWLLLHLCTPLYLPLDKPGYRSLPFRYQGLLVYANRGSEEDFKELEDQGINLKGTIALTRYGSVGRGAKVSSIHHAGIWAKGQQWTGQQEEEDREEAVGSRKRQSVSVT